MDCDIQTQLDVLIVDDQELLGEMLAERLERFGLNLHPTPIRVKTKWVTDLESAISIVNGDDYPGLVILDFNLTPSPSTSNTLKLFQERTNKRVPVVLFTGEEFTRERLHFLRECVGPLEARGVLLKSFSSEELTKWFARMLAGESVIPDRIWKLILEEKSKEKDTIRFNESQEIVIACLREGCTDGEIAQKLNRSKVATRQVVGQVYKKLNVHNRLAAVRELERRGRY